MKKYLLLIIAALLLPTVVNAANANIDIKTSSNEITKGNTFTVTVDVNSKDPIGYYEYTLDYDHQKLELEKGNSYNMEKANDGETKSFKKEFTFKVKDNSAAKISVKSFAVSTYRNDESMSVTVNPVTINSSSSSNSNTSNDNYLSSLEIEGYKIEPTFAKNTTNYILKIEDDINEINIKATASNSKASITGNGKHALSLGENRIEITVTSESGNDRTYTIKVTLSEKDPIKVKIDAKEYSVVKSLKDQEKIDGYSIKKIKINDKETESLYSETTKLTLVALKDSSGKISYFIYDSYENEYTPYNIITSGELSILPLNTNKKLKHYKLYTEIINDYEVKCYKTSNNSEYCILYAMNINDGKNNWYVYDTKDKTIQKYNKEENKYYKEKIKNTRVLIGILSGTVILFGVTTIVFAIKSNRKK